MRERIINATLEAHNKIDKRIWENAEGDDGLKATVLICIASAHVSAAVKLARFSGMSHHDTAKWLYSIADSYATEEHGL
jgi:hypothetical protein